MMGTLEGVELEHRELSRRGKPEPRLMRTLGVGGAISVSAGFWTGLLVELDTAAPSGSLPRLACGRRLPSRQD